MGEYIEVIWRLCALGAIAAPVITLLKMRGMVIRSKIAYARWAVAGMLTAFLCGGMLTMLIRRWDGFGKSLDEDAILVLLGTAVWICFILAISIHDTLRENRRVRVSSSMVWVVAFQQER